MQLSGTGLPGGHVGCPEHAGACNSREVTLPIREKPFIKHVSRNEQGSHCSKVCHKNKTNWRKCSFSEVISVIHNKCLFIVFCIIKTRSSVWGAGVGKAPCWSKELYNAWLDTWKILLLNVTKKRTPSPSLLLHLSCLFCSKTLLQSSCNHLLINC